MARRKGKKGRSSHPEQQQQQQQQQQEEVTVSLPLAELSLGGEEARFTEAEAEADVVDSFFLAYRHMACVRFHVSSPPTLSFRLAEPLLLRLLRKRGGLHRRRRGGGRRGKGGEEDETEAPATLTIHFPSPKAAAATWAFLEPRIDPNELLAAPSPPPSPSPATLVVDTSGRVLALAAGASQESQTAGAAGGKASSECLRGSLVGWLVGCTYMH